MTNSALSTRFNVNLPASSSCQELVEDVAQKLGYEKTSFCLTYERPDTSNQYEEVTTKVFILKTRQMHCTDLKIQLARFENTLFK